MPEIIPDTVVEYPKMDAEITLLENKNIDESVNQKLRNKGVYETYMHKI